MVRQWKQIKISNLDVIGHLLKYRVQMFRAKLLGKRLSENRKKLHLLGLVIQQNYFLLLLAEVLKLPSDS